MAYTRIFKESLGKTITIEFFVDSGKVWIRFNNREMLLKDFLRSKSPDGQKIIDIIPYIFIFITQILNEIW